MHLQCVTLSVGSLCATIWHFKCFTFITWTCSISVGVTCFIQKPIEVQEWANLLLYR